MFSVIKHNVYLNFLVQKPQYLFIFYLKQNKTLFLFTLFQDVVKTVTHTAGLL